MNNFSLNGNYSVKIHNLSSDLWNPKKVVKFKGGMIAHWLTLKEGYGWNLIDKGVYLIVEPEVARIPEIEYIPTVQDFVDSPYYEEMKKTDVLYGLIHERIEETIRGIRDKVDPYLKDYENKLEDIITNKVIREFIHNLDFTNTSSWSKSSKENRKILLWLFRQELPRFIDEQGFRQKINPTIDLIDYVPELHHLIPELLELRDLLIVSTVHAE